jgi:hypothetical protein
VVKDRNSTKLAISFQEKEVAAYCKNIGTKFCDVTHRGLRVLPSEYAEYKVMDHPFITKHAAQDSVHRFCKTQKAQRISSIQIL